MTTSPSPEHNKTGQLADRPSDTCKRIGILTFHRAFNFGAVLQTYALQKTLAQLNPEAQISVLDVVPPFMEIRDAPWHKFRKRAQQRAFQQFRDRHLALSGKRTAHIAEQLGDVDAIVVGSDQVWNPDLTKDAWATYFLDQVSETCRKFSYAASFGEGVDREFAPSVKQTMQQLLARFERISVREESGQAICRQLNRDDAVHVLDPVLVADPAIFDSLVAEAHQSKPAITAILLNETAEHRKLLRHLRKHSKQPAQIITLKQRRLPTLGIRRPFASSIPDYLSAIKLAPLVITDSFHAVMFSLVFQRPFVVTPSRANHRFERLANILALLGLQDRIAQQDDLEQATHLLHTPIDYSAIQPELQKLRQHSLSFLAQLC